MGEVGRPRGEGDGIDILPSALSLLDRGQPQVQNVHLSGSTPQANMADFENLEYMELLRSSYPRAHDINRECMVIYLYTFMARDKWTTLSLKINGPW